MIYKEIVMFEWSALLKLLTPKNIAIVVLSVLLLTVFVLYKLRGITIDGQEVKIKKFEEVILPAKEVELNNFKTTIAEITKERENRDGEIKRLTEAVSKITSLLKNREAEHKKAIDSQRAYYEGLIDKFRKGKVEKPVSEVKGVVDEDVSKHIIGDINRSISK